MNQNKFHQTATMTAILLIASMLYQPVLITWKITRLIYVVLYIHCVPALQQLYDLFLNKLIIGTLYLISTNFSAFLNKVFFPGFATLFLCDITILKKLLLLANNFADI